MKKLLEEARKVLPNAYVEYSNFPVAAAIQMKDGNIITGVNVENASYGLTNCAERSALFAAYSQGYKKDDIVEMVVTTAKDDIVSPCGACRQVMKELVPDQTPIHIVSNAGKVITVKNIDLLPLGFSKDDL